VIAVNASVLLNQHGLIVLIDLEIITSMLNALLKVFVIVILANVNAFLVMRVKAVHVLHALMIAVVMDNVCT
jgi:hypothetical protein